MFVEPVSLIIHFIAFHCPYFANPLPQVDFDDDDDVVKPIKNLKGLSDNGMGEEGGNPLEDLDGLLDKDKQTVLPLIIDGLEVDRDVSIRWGIDFHLLLIAFHRGVDTPNIIISCFTMSKAK